MPKKRKYKVYKVTYHRNGSPLIEPRYFTSLTKARKYAVDMAQQGRSPSYDVQVTGFSGSAKEGHYRWTERNLWAGTVPRTRYDVQIWELTGNSAKKLFRLAFTGMVKFEGVIPADIKAEFSYR